MNITVVIITALITSIVSAVVGGAVAWAVAKDKAMKEKKEQDKTDKEIIMKVLKLLLKDSYFRCSKDIISAEAVSDADFEIFDELWEAYTLLGMNGKGEWYHEQIKGKPYKN